ncbi:hypothetical protein [Chryseobacterium sp. CH1]|uniref:hypothetical protein n=1 Tax=Chryseobacterium sp. CH1 TaxID=713551 RepID=UPI001E297E20|nr:hypothetical protein [Chryseobacterium sp. CH1]
MIDIKPNFEGLCIEKYTVNTLSEFHVKAGNLNKLLLCFVSNGTLDLQINNLPYHIQANSIIMLLPDTNLGDISSSNDLELSVFLSLWILSVLTAF